MGSLYVSIYIYTHMYIYIYIYIYISPPALGRAFRTGCLNQAVQNTAAKNSTKLLQQFGSGEGFNPPNSPPRGSQNRPPPGSIIALFTLIKHTSEHTFKRQQKTPPKWPQNVAIIAPTSIKKRARGEKGDLRKLATL